MKLYIAGPMTGIPGFNYRAFEEAARRLVATGHEAVNPTELDTPEERELILASDGTHFDLDKTWGDYLSRDVKLLTDGGVDGVLVLRGWEQSRGARLETFLAHALLGLPIFRFGAGPWDEVLFTVSIHELVPAWASSKDWSRVIGRIMS